MGVNEASVQKLLNQTNWHRERKKLRSVLKACGLVEQVKWNKLCYSYRESNVVIIYGLKAYCAVGFFKGSLLKDDKGILVQPGKHSQAMRQIRFTSLDQITDLESTLIDYVRDAIRVEEAGLEVDFAEKENLQYPIELIEVLDDDAQFAQAFENLTPGRKRGYVLHFSAAKQAKTRTARVGKHREKILQGRGLSER